MSWFKSRGFHDAGSGNVGFSGGMVFCSIWDVT